MNENQTTQENNNKIIEIWKSVQNYEGLYEVSNLGRVRSLGRFVIAKCNSIAFKKEKILKPRIDHKGYSRVLLCKNAEGKGFRIHRLVALAFILNPNNLPQVNHKNNIKAQNNVENLEWITNLDNIRHAWKNGFKNRDCYPRGEKHYLTKLTDKLVREIKQNYVFRKFSVAKVAKKFNISIGTVGSIIYGHTWKHVTI